MNESNVTIYVYTYIYIDCLYYIHLSFMYVCSYSASSLDGAWQSKDLCYESHLISCVLTFGYIWHHVLDTADMEDLSKDDRYLD